MGKRYGRNQKRAARQREAELRNALTLASRAANGLRRDLADAENLAFKKFAQNSGLINAIGDRIAKEISWRLGDELFPYAQQIWREGTRRNHRPMLEVGLADAVVPTSIKTNVMRISIPAIEYRCVLEMH